MQEVRIWFKKLNNAKYISHLDLNRYMGRLFNRSKLPVWNTEGFNPHPFIVFTLPLSLGFEGVCESITVRLEREVSKEEILLSLNKNSAPDIVFYDVTEPVDKLSKVTNALYEIKYYPNENLSVEDISDIIKNLISQDEIVVMKKSKSKTEEFDIKPYLLRTEISKTEEYVLFNCILPAGSVLTVSPKLLSDAMKKYCNADVLENITRVKLLDNNLIEFK